MKIIQSNIANLPTKYGKFKIKAYKDGNQEHLAIMSEDFENIEIPFVRIHSECLTGDTLGSLKCDCQNQLDLALKFIAAQGVWSFITDKRGATLDYSIKSMRMPYKIKEEIPSKQI